MNEQTTYRIGELADEFQVTLRALRFYEDRGLLHPVKRKNTRYYSRRDRARLKLIVRAQAVGLTLTEVKHLIELYDQPDGSRLQLIKAKELLQDQRAFLEKSRSQIETSLTTIENMLAGMTGSVCRQTHCAA